MRMSVSFSVTQISHNLFSIYEFKRKGEEEKKKRKNESETNTKVRTHQTLCWIRKCQLYKMGFQFRENDQMPFYLRMQQFVFRILEQYTKSLKYSNFQECLSFSFSTEKPLQLQHNEQIAGRELVNGNPLFFFLYSFSVFVFYFFLHSSVINSPYM